MIRPERKLATRPSPPRRSTRIGALGGGRRAVHSRGGTTRWGGDEDLIGVLTGEPARRTRPGRGALAGRIAEKDVRVRPNRRARRSERESAAAEVLPAARADDKPPRRECSRGGVGRFDPQSRQAALEFHARLDLGGDRLAARGFVLARQVRAELRGAQPRPRASRVVRHAGPGAPSRYAPPPTAGTAKAVNTPTRWKSRTPRRGRWRDRRTWQSVIDVRCSRTPFGSDRSGGRSGNTLRVTRGRRCELGPRV